MGSAEAHIPNVQTTELFAVRHAETAASNSGTNNRTRGRAEVAQSEARTRSARMRSIEVGRPGERSSNYRKAVILQDPARSAPPRRGPTANRVGPRTSNAEFTGLASHDGIESNCRISVPGRSMNTHLNPASPYQDKEDS